MKAYTRTPFLNTFRVVHEQRDKKCLRNTNILNDLPKLTIPGYLWLNTKHLRNFRSDDLSQDESCELFEFCPIGKLRLFWKIIWIQNFIFNHWKFLQMPKLLCDVMKISGGQMPPLGCAPGPNNKVRNSCPTRPSITKLVATIKRS